MRAFPFVPKSINALEPGDFFPVRLEDGRYSCGRILQLAGDELPTKTQSFFGGLHDWIGTGVPTADDVVRSPMVEFGVMHVKAIQHVGSGVVGNVPLSIGLDEIPVLLDSMGGPAARLLKGVVLLRPARREEWGKLPVLGFWGYDFIRAFAESRFAG